MTPPGRAAARGTAELRRSYETAAFEVWLSAELLKNATLKVYEKFPHGMCTTHAAVINPDLLAFFRN